MNTTPEISFFLADSSSSFWLSSCLRSALRRDPFAAAADATLLASLLEKRAMAALTGANGSNEATRSASPR